MGRNAIDKLPADAFVGLTFLEVLDLRENSLKDIDSFVFRDGMAQLMYLNLHDNQLSDIPYGQLSSLKRLKSLDLSYNRITKMLNPQEEPELRGTQMSLDILRLDYNRIEFLPSGSFQHFLKVNRTYLDGNPITTIEVIIVINKSMKIFGIKLMVDYSKELFAIQEFENFISVIAIYWK